MEIKTSKLSDEDISMIDRINDTEHVLTDQYMPEKLRDAFVRGGLRRRRNIASMSWAGMSAERQHISCSRESERAAR